MKVLVVNCGSSSIKYQLINMENESVMAKGYLEKIGLPDSFLTHTVNGEKRKIEEHINNHEEGIKLVLAQLTHPEYGVISSLDEIGAVGHRVVHGGEKFSSSVLINDAVMEAMKECIPLAPLHNPAGITGIEACKKVLPNVPMVGVFDTAFHQTLPEKAYIYAIPYEYYEKYGIRKYGFHGTSHRFVSKRVAEVMNKPIEDLKILVCHLGQGASLCAVKGGKSIETTMGLTPLGGIPMGSRSGDLDPSVITYLIKNGINRLSIGVESFNKENLEFMERKMDYKDLEEKLNMIRAKGINNINLDLIYALPNESLDTLKKDVKKLLKLNPEHISTYSLIIEEDTKLKLNNTSYIDEELDAKMYDYICSKLKKHYTHYEVSNFAKEGFESKHNMAYWLNEEYYGFGLGASGYINGFRYENTHNLNDYLEGEYHKEESLLSNEEIMEYEVILGLRMLKGINLQTFFDKYGVNIQDVFPVKPLLKSKELIYKDGYLFINPNKIYVMNEILLKLV